MTTIILLLAGSSSLSAGAEILVRGASRLAPAIGVSPLVVGLTIVAFSANAPELAVSMASAFVGKADISIGIIVGGNIFNALFILGLSALITPLAMSQRH